MAGAHEKAVRTQQMLAAGTRTGPPESQTTASAPLRASLEGLCAHYRRTDCRPPAALSHPRSDPLRTWHGGWRRPSLHTSRQHSTRQGAHRTRMGHPGGQRTNGIVTLPERPEEPANPELACFSCILSPHKRPCETPGVPVGGC